MKFYPLNGYIQIEKVPERASTVLIPNDARSGPSIVVVKHIFGFDSPRIHDSFDSFLVVESHMIEKIEFEGNEIFIIPKSGIKGLFQK